MSNQATKTNNDRALFESKVILRIESIKHLEKVYVFELFGGEGVLWKEVKKRTNKEIKILSIDINKYSNIQLQGDNNKFIESIDLNKFHVIDIDAWGSPFYQLEKIVKKGYKGIIHCTFIQTMQGALSKQLLFNLGYTDKMINKIPSLFNKNGIDKFKEYLYSIGVDEIKIISEKRKNYLYFNLDK